MKGLKLVVIFIGLFAIGAIVSGRGGNKPATTYALGSNTNAITAS